MAQLSDDCFAFGGSLLGIDAARQMIFERVQPVEAIRLLHTETGIELKEARTVVESNAARLRPNVAVPSPGEVPRLQLPIYWLIAAAAIIVLVVYFFLQLKR